MIITEHNLLSVLQKHIGKQKGVSGVGLAVELSHQLKKPISLREIRSKIEALRLKGYHICGTPNDGYYMARNETELNESCEFLYSRAMKSLTQISAMKRASLPDLRGQLRLPN